MTRRQKSALNKAKHRASKKRLYAAVGRQHGVSFDSRGVIRRDKTRSKQWPIGRPI